MVKDSSTKKKLSLTGEITKEGIGILYTVYLSSEEFPDKTFTLISKEESLNENLLKDIHLNLMFRRYIEDNEVVDPVGEYSLENYNIEKVEKRNDIGYITGQLLEISSKNFIGKKFPLEVGPIGPHGKKETIVFDSRVVDVMLKKDLI